MEPLSIEAMMQRGDWPGALVATQAALQVTPTNPKLHAYLGLCYFRQNDFVNAEVSFRRAATLDPNFWEAGAKHAQCLDRLRRYEEAYEVAKHWQRINPRDRTLQGLLLGLEGQVRGNRTERWEKSQRIETSVRFSNDD